MGVKKETCGMKIYRMIPIRFTLNGEKISLEVAADETALHVIRERLSLKGTKEGCGMGECGMRGLHCYGGWKERQCLPHGSGAT